MEEGATMEPKSKQVFSKTINFLHRKAAAPAKALTSDVLSKTKRAKMTSWLGDAKIGGKKDITLQKKNPNPLIPPCGPDPGPRRLFSMQDCPEDFEKTMACQQEVKQSLPPASTVGVRPPES